MPELAKVIQKQKDDLVFQFISMFLRFLKFSSILHLQMGKKSTNSLNIRKKFGSL